MIDKMMMVIMMAKMMVMVKMEVEEVEEEKGEGEATGSYGRMSVICKERKGNTYQLRLPLFRKYEMQETGDDYMQARFRLGQNQISSG